MSTLKNKENSEIGDFHENGFRCILFQGNQNNRKGGTASLRLRTCVKRNAVFGARFKGLSLYFLYQKGNLIRIKTGLDTYLIRIQTRTPLSRYPPYHNSLPVKTP